MTDEDNRMKMFLSLILNSENEGQFMKVVSTSLKAQRLSDRRKQSEAWSQIINNQTFW